MSYLLSRSALINTDTNIIFDINADIINLLLEFIYSFFGSFVFPI